MGGDATNPLPDSAQLQILPHSHRRSAGRRRQLHHHFPPGTGVEVQTNEEDFKGVYFSATVLDPQNSPKKSGRKKSRKLYVEYQNLLAHEDGSDRLREYVDVAFVRPAPLVQEIVKGFEPDDTVDAFYKDGWWTGVVNRVVAGGERFVVTFSNPPDELEFGLGELRAHWDWVNGAWVRPQRQSVAGLMFDVGRKVEVSFDREDSQEAWFPATIHEDLGDGTFMVESNHAKTDKHTLAKARVDSLHIRPCPPLLKAKNFMLLEKVDAFFEFGWWSGVITRHLENSRYVVFFKQLKTDKQFTQSELRLHMEWKDGKWFTSSQEPSIPSLDDKASQHHELANTGASLATAPVTNAVNGGDTCFGKTNSSLILTNDHFEQFIPENQEASHATTSLTKKRGQLSDSGDALSQPLKKHREEENVGANTVDGANEEILSFGGLESPESLKHMETSVPQTTVDRSSSNHPWEKNVQRKQRNSRKSYCENNKSTSNFPQKSTAEVLLDLDFEEKEPEAAGKSEEGAQQKHAKHETELAVVIGLPCPQPGSSGVSESNRSRSSDKKVHIDVDDQRQLIYDFTNQAIKDVKQSGIGEVSEKRKRGRPKKVLLESIETLSVGNPEHGSHSSGDLNKKDDDSQRLREVEMIGMEASTSNQDQTMPNQDKMVQNKEKTILNPEKMAPSQEKKEMVRSHEKIVPNLEQMSQNPVNTILDPNKTLYQEKTVQNQKKTTPYQEKTTSNQRKTISYQEKIAPIQKKTVSNPKKAALQEKAAQNQEKAVQNPKKTALVQEKTLSDQEKTTPNQEKTTPKQEKTKPNEEKTKPDQEKTMPDQEKTMPDQEKTMAEQGIIGNGRSGLKKRKVRMTKAILAGNHGKTGVMESVRLGENVSPKKGWKHIPNGRIAVKVREFHGASRDKVTLVNHTVHEEKAKQPSNEFDNEPLSKWIEEIHQSSAIDGSRLVPEDTEAQRIANEGSEQQPESERQSRSLVDKGDITQTEPQSLPSENNSGNVVLDEVVQKQSDGGTETPLSVDNVSNVETNVEETALVLPDPNGEKQSQNEAQATPVADKSPVVPTHRQSSLKGTVEAVLDKDNEKRPESVTGVDNASIVPSETESLPFTKNTVLWKTIESMEVFQRLPQKPHFHPLLNFKESSREGLAIGHMVTFSSLVERASKLQLNDPVFVMEDIKETLTELEKHGFTGGPIKETVDELLAMKDNEEKLANDAQTLRSKINEHSEVKTRMEREIEEIKGHIQNLQKKVSEVESSKDRADEEIAFLQVRLRETEDSIKNLKNGFKDTVSSIL